MTNQEYTKKYHSLTNLHLEEGSLLRYVDGEGLNVGFVVDIGDAENEFGIEEYRSYPYNVIDNLNDRLKDKRLATIKYVINEKSLAYYVENFTSFAYQRLYEVKLIDVAVETNHGKGYNIVDSGLSLWGGNKIIKSGLTLTEAKEYLRDNYHPFNSVKLALNPEENQS